MIRRLAYLAAASDDLDQIADFVLEEADNVNVAKALVSRLQQRCQRLADLPGILGQSRNQLAPGLRSTPDGSYIIFFRYEYDLVEIVTIVHAARDLDTLFEATRD